MCGIVSAAARRDVLGILIEGLQRLEYRGHDSAGVALISPAGAIRRRRQAGKVQALVDAVQEQPPDGLTGIAHTRWATHGVPSEANAHPQASGADVAIVHNGIIENHEELRAELVAAGYEFTSETDSEVIAHLLHQAFLQTDALQPALAQVVTRLHGSYAIAAIHCRAPDRIVAARHGSPLVVGVGIGENFVASDVMALRPVTDRFIVLEEGDLVEVTRDRIAVWDSQNAEVTRSSFKLDQGYDEVDKGAYRHHMKKEIHEQPQVIRNTLEGHLYANRVLEEAFGLAARPLFDRVKAVSIIACGTSYYAGLVARYWIEDIVGIPCQVDIASEFRYRSVAVLPGTLLVTISQSGETADTLAALRLAKTADDRYAGSLAICNVPTSSLVRESDIAVMLQAGHEIGVASTKAFTAQLANLMLLTLTLARRHRPDRARETALCEALVHLPSHLERALDLDERIHTLAESLVDHHHALFLGRGSQYPIALEGALKLKEISYIHAEGYPAGELKHGPLALVDADMPVIAVAPNNELFAKLVSNLEEVRARGGRLLVFADETSSIKDAHGITVVPMPSVPDAIAPIVYTVPMQLLAYHVAVLRGTDVDQPRNLAKSVTVE